MSTYNPTSGLSTLAGILEDLEMGRRIRRADWPAGCAVYLDQETEQLVFERPGAKPHPYIIRRNDLTEHAWDEARS